MLSFLPARVRLVVVGVASVLLFPNIANSIASDLGYVKMLITAGSLLPRGLFLNRTIQVCSP
jgi:aarF domain-containing kinase